MNPSSLLTKRLPTLSLSQKLILGFLAVIFVLSTGMIVTLYNVNRVEKLGDNVIDMRQPISLNALKAEHALTKSQSILHSYLLTGSPKLYEEYIQELESLELIIGSLIRLSKNIGQDTQLFSLDSAFVTISQLRKFGDRLRNLQSNYEENHPILGKAVELINPAALKFLGKINDMIM